MFFQLLGSEVLGGPRLPNWFTTIMQLFQILKQSSGFACQKNLIQKADRENYERCHMG
ncbi:hypothetical protein LguiA_021762 [Lonicera macranthoides]